MARTICNFNTTPSSVFCCLLFREIWFLFCVFFYIEIKWKYAKKIINWIRTFFYNACNYFLCIRCKSHSSLYFLSYFYDDLLYLIIRWRMTLCKLSLSKINNLIVEEVRRGVKYFYGWERLSVSKSMED